jgi:hypothetical protein
LQEIEYVINLLKSSNYSDDDDQLLLTQQKTLRKLIGVLGFFLPWILLVMHNVFRGCDHPMESISHYYFTRVSTFFVISVSLTGIFLIIYKGKGVADFILSTLAGVCALLLLLYPTDNIDPVDMQYSVLRDLAPNEFRVKFHYIVSGIFLLSLAAISAFIFTKWKKEDGKTKEKEIRNVIFYACAAIMFLGVLTIVYFLQIQRDPEVERRFVAAHMTFWMETTAVCAFGISWLVKGEAVLADGSLTKKTNKKKVQQKTVRKHELIE